MSSVVCELRLALEATAAVRRLERHVFGFDVHDGAGAAPVSDDGGAKVAGVSSSDDEHNNEHEDWTSADEPSWPSSWAPSWGPLAPSAASTAASVGRRPRVLRLQPRNGLEREALARRTALVSLGDGPRSAAALVVPTLRFPVRWLRSVAAHCPIGAANHISFALQMLPAMPLQLVVHAAAPTAASGALWSVRIFIAPHLSEDELEDAARVP